MLIALTGSSGLIGSALISAFTAQGHTCVRLVRSNTPSTSTDVQWNPESEERLNDHRLEDLDVVIHLAGENIAGRWTKDKKAKILQSRVRGTSNLSRSLANLGKRPKLFLSASAIGYYGDTGDHEIDESAGPGQGFLPSVCVAWEAATEAAVQAGIRVVNMRIGVVLSPSGGLLQKILPIFRRGVGGKLGGGHQYMSWITLEDIVKAVGFLIENESIQGPVNLCSPVPTTNLEFTNALGRALSRPTIFPVPYWAAKLALGQMADETAFLSSRVLPSILLKNSYTFQESDLQDALSEILARQA